MFNLLNRGELNSVTEHEFENLNARLKNLWLVEHNDDGTHQTDLWGFADEVHVHSADDVTSGALAKARQHAQTAYKDEANTWTLNQTLTGIAIINGGTVRFPATQVPSAGANDLDDYEENTWTPVLAFGGASVGITYSTQRGLYTKIGNWVYIELEIVLTAVGSSTGDATITGCPFSAANPVSGTLDCVTGMVGLTGAPFNVIGNTTLNPVQTSATGRTRLNETHFSNTSQFRSAVMYRV